MRDEEGIGAPVEARVSAESALTRSENRSRFREQHGVTQETIYGSDSRFTTSVHQIGFMVAHQILLSLVSSLTGGAIRKFPRTGLSPNAGAFRLRWLLWAELTPCLDTSHQALASPLNIGALEPVESRYSLGPYP